MNSHCDCAREFKDCNDVLIGTWAKKIPVLPVTFEIVKRPSGKLGVRTDEVYLGCSLGSVGVLPSETARAYLTSLRRAEHQLISFVVIVL